jgi:hypothetical protein
VSIRVQDVEPKEMPACVEFLETADGRVASILFGFADAAAGIEDARYVKVAWEERPKRFGGDRIAGLAVGEVEDAEDGVEVRLTLAIRDACAADGVMTQLMSATFAAIAFDQDVSRLVVTVPPLTVRGRLLADCFGLTEEGLIVSDAQGESDGATQWARTFHRDEAGPGMPLFYLEDVVDAMEEQGDGTIAYGDLKSGNLTVDYHFDGEDEDEGERDDSEPEASWRELPGRYEMHDMGTMRTFARAHGGALSDDLLGATHGRGAYRRFKDMTEEHNLLGVYLAYQRDAHREVAIGWLEDLGLPWTEGSRPRGPRLVD